MRAVELATRITGVTKRDGEFLGLCPAHADKNASLTFRDGEKGLLLKCFAGCRADAICEALGLKLRDLFFDSTNGQKPTARPHILAIYSYCDENNTLLYEVVRFEPKDFRQRRPDGNGGWIWNLKDVRLLVYRLPELFGEKQIFVVEGEKDADRLGSLGLAATCNNGGAGKWSDDLTGQLVRSGAETVTVLPDNDDPGRQHVGSVARSCAAAGLLVKIVALPNLPLKGDVSDWLDAGGTVEQLEALVAAAPEWTPDESDEVEANSNCEDASDDTLRLTDVGNGQLFARQYRDDIRYCYPFKSWLVCDEGALWVRCPGNRIMQLAKATVLGLYDVARHETDDARRTKLAAHAVKSESVQRLQAMIDLARSEPGIAITPDAFDVNPWLFSVSNGVLYLKTGRFRERIREDLITKLSPVVFDPTASCPTWLRFLGRIFQDDQRVITYVQHIVGYCLTGLTIEQVFFLLWGTGSNGKSTLLKVLLKLFGDYGLQMPAETFLSRTQDGRATPDLARLQGARLAVAIESDEGCRLAEGSIKQMTGSDRIAARRLYQDFIEFEPTHKILFATNHKPRVRDNTHAMWRRMRLIPFEAQIPDSEQDPTLPDKLLAEQSGILNWALAGCLTWQQAGRLRTPDPVIAATASYRTEQDVLDDFLGERCFCGLEEIVEFSELRKAYADWADDVSERPLSSKAFAAALRERGFTPTKVRNARHYRGLRLRTITDELADAQRASEEGQSMKRDDGAGEPQVLFVEANDVAN